METVSSVYTRLNDSFMAETLEREEWLRASRAILAMGGDMQVALQIGATLGFFANAKEAKALLVVAGR